MDASNVIPFLLEFQHEFTTTWRSQGILRIFETPPDPFCILSHPAFGQSNVTREKAQELMNCYLSGEPPWLALKSCLVFVVAWLHPQVIRARTELWGREKTSNLCATDRVVRTIPDLSHFSRYRPRNLRSFAAPWLTDTKNRDDRVWDWRNIDKNGLFHMNWARNTGKLDLFVETYKQVPLGLMVGTQRFTKCKRIHITQIAVNS